MAFARRLFVNTHTKLLIRSHKSGGPDVSDGIIKFAKYENAPLIVMLLEPDPDVPGPNSFQIVDITDLSLKAVINDSYDDASPLVEQTTWTKDVSAGTFSGNLNLHTAAMNTYVGSADKTPYFELQVTDGGGGRVKVFSSTCTVQVGVAQVTTTAPDSAKVYLSLDEAIGIFLPRRAGNGETLTLISPDGTHERVLGMRDDGTPQDDYT